MAYPRSAAPVHLCGDKTRVFDIKPWRELTYSQDKYPPIHQNNKMSTNAGATPFLGGGYYNFWVSFQMKGIQFSVHIVTI